MKGDLPDLLIFFAICVVTIAIGFMILWYASLKNLNERMCQGADPEFWIKYCQVQK